jgi:hypothetical protein
VLYLFSILARDGTESNGWLNSNRWLNCIWPQDWPAQIPFGVKYWHAPSLTYMLLNSLLKRTGRFLLMAMMMRRFLPRNLWDSISSTSTVRKDWPHTSQPSSSGIQILFNANSPPPNCRGCGSKLSQPQDKHILGQTCVDLWFRFLPGSFLFMGYVHYVQRICAHPPSSNRWSMADYYIY